MAELLEISGLTKRFGGLVAVNNVSFSVREKEILSVIGPNGAGKSTLFKLIASFLPPTSGEVRMRGESLSDSAARITAHLDDHRRDRAHGTDRRSSPDRQAAQGRGLTAEVRASPGSAPGRVPQLP